MPVSPSRTFSGHIGPESRDLLTTVSLWPVSCDLCQRRTSPPLAGSSSQISEEPHISIEATTKTAEAKAQPKQTSCRPYAAFPPKSLGKTMATTMPGSASCGLGSRAEAVLPLGHAHSQAAGSSKLGVPNHVQGCRSRRARSGHARLHGDATRPGRPIAE